MRGLGTIRALVTNTFIRSVGVLVGGTAFAQAILGVTLPIATRIYTPADFNVLAVFTGIVSMISVAICLRLDVAVPIPEHDGEAANIVALATASALGIAMLLLFAALIAPGWIASGIGQRQLAPYLWLIPLASMLAGLYSTLQFWFVRKKLFGTIARNRIAQAAGSSATQIGLGLAGLMPLGLVLGQVVNSGLGVFRLAYLVLRDDRPAFAEVSASSAGAVLRKYGRFPKYSTFEAVANSASIYLPIIMLGALTEGADAGFLMLGMYAMQIPMSLIGNAVAQVYMSRGPAELRSGQLGEFTVRVLAGLIKTGVGPLCFIGIVAPDLFEIVFGGDWRRAGVLVTWMTPWFVLQFLASPLSLALHITNHLRTALILQLVGLVLRTGAVYGAMLLPGHYLSEAYSLSGAVFYGAYLVLVLFVCDCKFGDVRKALREGAAFVLLWCLAALTVHVPIQILVGLPSGPAL